MDAVQDRRLLAVQAGRVVALALAHLLTLAVLEPQIKGSAAVTLLMALGRVAVVVLGARV